MFWSNVAPSLRRALLSDAPVETSQLDKPPHRVKVGSIEGGCFHILQRLSWKKPLKDCLLPVFKTGFYKSLHMVCINDMTLHHAVPDTSLKFATNSSTPDSFYSVIRKYWYCKLGQNSVSSTLNIYHGDR